jgi:hypothetical protein
MNANMVMAYVDEIPTMVPSDKAYIRMLITNAVKRMPPPLTEDEENARKADSERLANDRVTHLREQGERAAEIAARDAERDVERAEGAVESARSNVEAVKQNAAAIADAAAAGREPGNPTLSGTPVFTGAAEREASEAAGAPSAGEESTSKRKNKHAEKAAT